MISGNSRYKWGDNIKIVIQQAQDSMQGRDDVNTVRDHMIQRNMGELSDQLNDYHLLKSTVP